MQAASILQNIGRQARAPETQVHIEVGAFADGKTKHLIIRAPEWKTKSQQSEEKLQ